MFTTDYQNIFKTGQKVHIGTGGYEAVVIGHDGKIPPEEYKVRIVATDQPIWVKVWGLYTDNALFQIREAVREALCQVAASLDEIIKDHEAGLGYDWNPRAEAYEDALEQLRDSLINRCSDKPAEGAPQE